MADQVPSQNPSCIPVPITKAPPSPSLLTNGNEDCVAVVPALQAESSPDDIDSHMHENGHNGAHADCEVAVDSNSTSNPKGSKVPKPIAPKDLLIDKGKKCLSKGEKGFETFLMTGDMMIKTNLKQKKGDGTTIERHHSDSSAYEESTEKRSFKRSASSPDQSTLLGATVMSHDNITMDNISKALDTDGETVMDRKESAESGFEDQAVNSDSGTLEKKDKMSNDPTSVSDLSEVDSDDLLGNMVSSQTSARCINSTLSTPSDLRSDVSINTVLQQEVEPLLNDDSSSSSSIDISSSGSYSEDLSPEMIYERSLSDSGGMSPVYQKEIKSLLTSKSAEKIVIQKQLRLVNRDHQSVRASKSQENYVGDDLTFVSIDIDDTAYSLDQIPQPSDPTPTEEHRDMSASFPESSMPRMFDGDRGREVSEQTKDERIFMPGFVKLSDSMHSSAESSGDKSDEEKSANENDDDLNNDDDDDDDSVNVDYENEAQSLTQGVSTEHGACCVEDQVDNVLENTTTNDSSDEDECDIVPEINQEDLFALPPAKSVDQPSAKRLAKRLYNLDGFRKSDVSRHLSKKNDFNTAVAEEYLKFFDFKGDNLDVALRKFLKQFSLIGETQERERVLAHFSRHYLATNPGNYNSEDACHTLVCAIMLLNTDLHGQTVGRKMSCNEFIDNLADLNDGDHFPKEVLKALYYAIKAEPIEWAPDEEFHNLEAQTSEDQKPATPAAPSGPNLTGLPPVVGRNPFLDVPDPSQTTEYKRGYIMRKCCVEPDGRKTPMGKRSWKMFFVVLRDMILYMYKDEQALKKSANVGSHNAIRIHHCYASKATDYAKKQHVLRLQTSDWAQYLFQTSNTRECQEWIDTMNYVAASLSAPPLPGAVGSQKRFQRPLLPASYTRLNLQDQLKSVEERLQQSEEDLMEHRQFPPEKGSKSSTIQAFLEKENYLTYEASRLKTYMVLLQSRLATQPELEPSLVETAIGEDEEETKGANLNNHAPVTSPNHQKAMVQRSISDRESPFGSPMADKEVPAGSLLYNQHGELVNQESEVTRF